MRHGAPMPSQHLSHRHRHAEARAARQVPRQARTRRALLHEHRRRPAAPARRTRPADAAGRHRPHRSCSSRSAHDGKLDLRPMLAQTGDGPLQLARRAQLSSRRAAAHRRRLGQARALRGRRRQALRVERQRAQRRPQPRRATLRRARIVAHAAARASTRHSLPPARHRRTILRLVRGRRHEARPRRPGQRFRRQRTLAAANSSFARAASWRAPSRRKSSSATSRSTEPPQDRSSPSAAPASASPFATRAQPPSSKASAITPAST